MYFIESIDSDDGHHQGHLPCSMYSTMPKWTGEISTRSANQRSRARRVPHRRGEVPNGSKCRGRRVVQPYLQAGAGRAVLAVDQGHRRARRSIGRTSGRIARCRGQRGGQVTTHAVNGPSRLRTASEAAEHLNDKVKVSWLETKAYERKIPHVKLGGRIYFTDQHLDEIIAQFERRPEAPKAAPAPRRRSTPGALAGAVQLQARRPRRRGAA